MIRTIIVILLFCSVGLGACRKDKTSPEPEEKTGILTGTVYPVGTAKAVVILKDGESVDKAQHTVPDPTTGKFIFSALKPGTYALMAEPNNGFAPIDNQAIEIISQQESTAVLFFKANQVFPITTPDMPISFKSGFSTRVLFNNQTLTISKFRSEGNRGKLNFKTFELTIKLYEVTGPGTYICDATSRSSVNYVSAYDGTIGFRTWGSKTTKGNATVTITNFDPDKRNISGTFTGSLPAISGTTGTVIIQDCAVNMSY